MPRSVGHCFEIALPLRSAGGSGEGASRSNSGQWSWVKGLLLSVLVCLAVVFVGGCMGTTEGPAQEEAAEASDMPDTTQDEAEASADRPNVVFVLTDDLDYASAQQMPEIGSLLRDGGPLSRMPS